MVGEAHGMGFYISSSHSYEIQFLLIADHWSSFLLLVFSYYFCDSNSLNYNVNIFTHRCSQSNTLCVHAERLLQSDCYFVFFFLLFLEFSKRVETKLMKNVQITLNILCNWKCWKNMYSLHAINDQHVHKYIKFIIHKLKPMLRLI